MRQTGVVRIGFMAALAVLPISACAASTSPQASTTSSPAASISAQPSPQLRTFVAANFATALAWAPDGRLFYAERGGTIRSFDGNASRVFASVSVSTSGERGLLGLAISPSFSSDRFVYAFYSRADDQSRQRVVRWKDEGGTGTALTTVIDNLPGGTDCCHKGGRIAFGPDGKLYVTVGENHVANEAQSTSSLRGKVLRYNADGGVPADNPFGNNNPVWAIGFRNPFGLAFSPDGKLFVTDNGPSGDAGSPGSGYDEVDLVVRGGNYQWPTCYGDARPLRSSQCAGTAPTYQSGSTTLVPTGVSVVSAKGPAGYQGDVVFCSYAQARLKVLSSDGRQLLFDGPKCQLDVKEGPDHALYFSDASAIYRLGS